MLINVKNFAVDHDIFAYFNTPEIKIGLKQWVSEISYFQHKNMLNENNKFFTTYILHAFVRA